MIPAHTFLGLRAEEIAPAAEEEFFASLRMRNGTYKTTFRNRFASIDRAIRELVDAGRIRVDSVLDVAISSGTSTLELYEALGAPERPIQIVATDVTLSARLVKVFPGCFTLADDTGFPLRHDLFGWSVKPWVSEADYRTGFFALRKAINIVFTRRARRLWRDGNSANVEAVELVTARLRAHGQIAVQRDDINVYNPEFAGRFDFIRAANILNRGYFTDSELRGAAENLRRYLVSGCGGALLVVRTHEDGSNHGTLFGVRAPGECDVVRRFGDGSEVEELMLAALRSPARRGTPVKS